MTTAEDALTTVQEQALRDARRIADEITRKTHGVDPFAEAVRATRMPMVITNPRLDDNPVVFANDAFCRLSGFRRDEIIGRNCRFLQGPQTDPAAVARIREAVAAVMPLEIDIKNHRKTGEMFWNRLLMAPVFTSDGTLSYFFASQVDVTLERERLAGLEIQNAALLAEQTHRAMAQQQADSRRLGLLEMADRLREVEDPADIAHLAGEVLGNTLHVSSAGYGIVDTARETVKIVRDWRASGQDSLAGVLAFREYGTYIEDLTRGQIVVVNDTGTNPRTAATAAALAGIGVRSFVNLPLTEHGAFMGLLFLNHHEPRVWAAADIEFMREVGERTRAAMARREAERDLREFAAALERLVEERTAALRDSQARMRAVFETSYQFQGLLAVDGSVLDANATSLAAIDCALSDIAGHKLGDTPWFTGTPGMADTLTAALAAAAAGETIRQEWHLNLPVGGWRWFDYTLRPLRDAAGTIIAIVPEAVEQTEQRNAEEALRQSQKMEAVGQLTGGIAHDFNNLLTGISGSLELLETRIAQGRVGQLDRYIGTAQGAAKRAAALTHRLLAFSRRQTLDPKPTDAGRLISDLEDLVRRTVGPAVMVRTVAASGLWRARIDANQLENALLNLCINARHAMPDGGKLTVEAENVTLDPRAARERDVQPGQYVSLCVTDTGTGMPAEVIARAFDPFFTTKPLGEGTGLGLSMVYGFARQSGGQARIHSTLGLGTTVRLYLPRHIGAGDTPDETSTPLDLAEAQPGETVLVVDDEPTVRLLVVEVLEELGYAAIEAADGKSGLKILETSRRIDLMVTDVGLPGGMNGRQLADAGWMLRPALKVLFITGYAENAVLGNETVRDGMHVLTKPFGMDTLASRIRGIIHG